MFPIKKTAIVAAALLSLSLSPPAVADTLTIPNTFTPGTTISASQVNGNFTAISTWSTLISNANIKTGANIAPSKLDFTAQIGPILRTAANNCFSAGVTGDTQPRCVITSDGYIKFGPGSSTALDLMIKRTDANTISIRDAGDTTNKNLNVGAIAGSSMSLTTPLPATSGGTGLSSLGTATYLLRVNGAGNALEYVSPAGANTGAFGGDGGDGAITTNASNLSVNQINATTVTIANTTTFKAPPIMNCTSTFTLQGNAVYKTASSGVGGFAGGAALATANEDGMRGFGPNAGEGGRGADKGGGGGGGSCVASGGDGGNAIAGANGAGTGGQVPTTNNAPVCVGSGGGTGGSGAGGAGGAGGQGGAILRVCARGAITLGGAGGSIEAIGSAGSPGSTLAGGGGGGGGGVVALYSQSGISSTGATIDVYGGAGANGAGASGGGGGGGGGGLSIRMSPSNGSVTVNLNGGTGGTGTANGSNGSNGLDFTLTGTPNLPLVGYHADMRGLLAHASLIRAKRLLTGGDMDHIAAEHREHAGLLAAFYAKPGQFDNLCYALMHGGGKEAASFACVDVMPAFESVGNTTEFKAEPRESTAVGDLEVLANAV